MENRAWKSKFIIGLASLLLLNAAAASSRDQVVVASNVGAKLDSDLMKGGGTDDTAVLQRALDTAVDLGRVHLIIDGPALVSGLNVYRNSVVECTAGGGLYLKDRSSRAIVRNAHRSRDLVVDEHIEIRGCFFNGNRNNQPSADIVRPDTPHSGDSNKEPDGTYISGLEFLGVNYLTIRDVTLWNIRAFAAQIANASYVDIRNVIIDHGGGENADATKYVNTDGLHFKGPTRYVSIDTVKIRVGDDGIAFSPNDYETNDVTTRNDFGPYVGQGPITDITVNNVQFMNATDGIRILSTNERVDRIVISNVVGTISKYYLMTIGHFMNRNSFGNVGKITLQNVSVDRAPQSPAASPAPVIRKDDPWYGEANGGAMPLININGHIESLQIDRLTTQVSDARPLLRIGPEAAVGAMNVDMTAHDPAVLGTILQLDEGGRVDQLNMALSWQGLEKGKCKSPVVNQGGKVARIRWLSDSPCN